MRKYTLRELKNLVRCGMAHDLTNAPAAEVKEQWKHCEKSATARAYTASMAV